MRCGIVILPEKYVNILCFFFLYIIQTILIVCSNIQNVDESSKLILAIPNEMYTFVNLILIIVWLIIVFLYWY